MCARRKFIRSVVPYHPGFRISPYLFELSGMIENIGVVIYDDDPVGSTVDRKVKAIEALRSTSGQRHLAGIPAYRGDPVSRTYENRYYYTVGQVLMFYCSLPATSRRRSCGQSGA